MRPIESELHQINTNLPPPMAWERVQRYMASPPGSLPVQVCLSGILSLDTAGMITPGSAMEEYLKKAVAPQFGWPLVYEMSLNTATLKVVDDQPTLEELQAELKAARILGLDQVELYKPYIAQAGPTEQIPPAPTPTASSLPPEQQAAIEEAKKQTAQRPPDQPSPIAPAGPTTEPVGPEASGEPQTPWEAVLADPEKRKQVEEIISQIRSVYNQDGRSLFPLEVQLSDGSSDKRDLDLLDLQRQFSNILNLPEDESYQTLESIVSIGQNIHLIFLPRFINGNRQRGTLDTAIVLLRDMYTSTPGKLQVQLQQAIDYLQDKGHYSNYSAFFDTQRAAAGVDTEQMKIIFNSDFTAINRLDKLFSNLFSDEEDIPVEKTVQAFIDRNRKVIICSQSQNEWNAKVGKFEQSLAKEHNIKITYGETQGDAILERMTPDEQIEQAVKGLAQDFATEEEYDQRVQEVETKIVQILVKMDPVEAAHLIFRQNGEIRSSIVTVLDRSSSEQARSILRLYTEQQKARNSTQSGGKYVPQLSPDKLESSFNQALQGLTEAEKEEGSK